MPQPRQRGPFGVAAWPLRGAFFAIIAIFVLVDLLGVVDAHRAQTANQRVGEAMLSSVELVSRIRHDLDQKRLLIDAHIFEKEAVNMDRLEIEMAGVDRDFADAARRYEELGALAEERAPWVALKTEAAGADRAAQRVLALSRNNKDAEARSELLQMETAFLRIDDDATQLIDANRAHAERAVAEIQARQRASLQLLVALAMVGVVSTMLIAAWVTRSINRRQAEVSRLAEQLEERNRELDAFAGRVAHDLRGPLNAVALASARLADCTPGADASAVLRRGIARMDLLIRDLLTLSRLDTQSHDLTCDPEKAAALIADELHARAREAGGTLRLDVESACVRCSEGLLAQTLGNLVENAVKYRRDGMPPEIEVRGKASGKTYHLGVSDNGIGMSDEDALHAFEPFYRAPRSQEMPGTGLGLSIVKRTVEAFGGSVSVTTQLDRGSAFTLHLPLASAPARQPSYAPPLASTAAVARSGPR